MSTATLLNESPSRFESVVSTVPSQPARRELRALTGLRFVAAFAVVIYHFSSVFAARWPAPLRRLADSGYISVDLFFLLSGFVLAYGYLGDRPAMRGTKRAFWSARFARIYPAYLLAFLLAIPANVIGSLHANSLRVAAMKLATGAGAVLTMVQAWTPWTAWYWNYPAWSVSVEAFFYLTFPFAVPVLARIRSRGALLALAGLWIAGLMAPAWLVATHHVFAGPGLGDHLQMAIEFTPLLRVPEFFAGILLGRMFAQRGGVPAASPFLSLISAGAIIALLAWGHIPHPLLANGLLLPLFALLIVSLAEGRGLVAKVLSTRPLVMLGEASYGIYILQIPVAYVTGMRPPHATVGTFVLYSAVLIATAIASFYLVESPMRCWLKTRFG